MNKPRVGTRDWEQMTVDEAKMLAEQLKQGAGVGGLQNTHRALTDAGVSLKALDFDIQVALNKIGISWTGAAAELATSVMSRVSKVSSEAGNCSQSSGVSVQSQGQSWADTKNKAPSPDELKNTATESWFERNITRPIGFDTDVTIREAAIKQRLKEFGDAMRTYENGSRDRADTGHRPLPEMPVLTAAAPDAPPQPPPPISPGTRPPGRVRPGGGSAGRQQGGDGQGGFADQPGPGQEPRPGEVPPPRDVAQPGPRPVDHSTPVWDVPQPGPSPQPPPPVAPPGYGAPGSGSGVGPGGGGGGFVGGFGAGAFGAGGAGGSGSPGAGGSAGIGAGTGAGARAPVGPGRSGAPGSFLQQAAPAAGGAGVKGEEDKEHSRRFWQASDEPFVDDRQVAPPVIGE